MQVKDTPYLSFPPMRNNAKLAKAMTQAGQARGYHGKYLTFSLPAAWSCPFAHECKSFANPDTGHITDGEHTLFRCYAATQEARHTQIRESRHRNYQLLLDAFRFGSEFEMYTLIRDSITHHKAWNNGSVIRIHVSGDFFNPLYFTAWQRVAHDSPDNLYYAYTKALPYVVKYGDDCPNLRIVASKGGTHDHLIEQHGLRSAEVVFSTHEAEVKGLAIDHDDTTAAFTDDSFALLLHGTQPKGTTAAEALKFIRLEAA